MIPHSFFPFRQSQGKEGSRTGCGDGLLGQYQVRNASQGATHVARFDPGVFVADEDFFVADLGIVPTAQNTQSDFFQELV